MEELTSIEELTEIYKEEKKSTDIVEKKSITDLSANDITVAIDHSKSMEQQAEDIVGAMATARAVEDEQTAKELTENKAEELKAKAKAKEKKAETERVRATTEQQKAQREHYEAVLETFGIFKHLPKWLMVALVFIFSPIYIFLNVLIGIPCGFVKVLIINIDGILTRFEEANETRKPKIRLTVWLILGIVIVGIIGYIVLKVTNVIQ